jgi:hypothetical protein
MIRFVLALSALALFADTAECCQRCGLFGNRCRFHHVAKVVAPAYVAPVYAQPSVLVVQNAYSAPIAQQGATLYGYRDAAQQYFVNPNEFARNSAEFVRAASTSFQLGVTGYNQMAQTQLSLQAQIAEPLARGVAASQVLNAAGFSQPNTQQRQSLAVEIYTGADGTLKIKQLSGEEANAKVEAASGENQDDPFAVPPPAPAPDRSASIIGQRCAKCHGLQLAEPKGGKFFDAGNKLDCNLSWLAVRQIKSGKMPPASEPPLTAEEKGLLLDELDSLTELDQQ